MQSAQTRLSLLALEARDVAGATASYSLASLGVVGPMALVGADRLAARVVAPASPTSVAAASSVGPEATSVAPTTALIAPRSSSPGLTENMPTSARASQIGGRSSSQTFMAFAAVPDSFALVGNDVGDPASAQIAPDSSSPPKMSGATGSIVNPSPLQLALSTRTGGSGSITPNVVGSLTSPAAAPPNQSSANDQMWAALNHEGALGNISADGLDIPLDHPRIWWTPDRLTNAQLWYSQYPFQPNSGDAWNNALAYVITGQQSYARAAITLLMNFTISDSELQSVASDTYRWNDWVPVVYDWCYDVMTPTQRGTFMDRYNNYVEIMSQKPWGSPGMDANNYFWGYFRNEVNWAIATYYENPMAQEFLDHAIIDRWDNSFLDYAANGGAGGVPVEGSQYGAYMLGYPVVPLTTAATLGRDLWQETNFYKEAVFYTIYSTSPSPVQRKDLNYWYYQVFPFGDDENDGGYHAASDINLGDFMTAATLEFAGTAVGDYAAQWLNQVNPNVDNYVWMSAPYNGSHPGSLGSLPTDYYAPGPGYFFSRNSWDSNATSEFFQLGQETQASHTQYDDGSFQIVRGDEYLTKESTGYLTRFNGGTSNDAISKNSILFNGRGMALNSQDGLPVVLRLQSDDNFSYAAVDLSQAYRAHGSTDRERDDNPYANHIIREFIYIKPLETTIVLDRLQSSSDAIPASQVQKTFLLHFPQPPVQDSPNSFLEVNGDQALRVTSLGQQGTYDVVDEAAFSGQHLASSYYQYRLQENITGNTTSYFLHVLQARDADGADLSIDMTQDSNQWTITLDHPALGEAKIILNKGITSTGGEIAYSPDGPADAFVPFFDHVQGIQVTDDGPVWGD